MKKLAYPLKLSKYDEDVPNSYASIYRLLSSLSIEKKTIAFREPEEKIDQMRLNTFLNVKKHFDESEATNFASYFNTHWREIIQLNLNEFSKNKGLRNILHLIECFELKSDSKRRLDALSIGTKKIYKDLADIGLQYKVRDGRVENNTRYQSISFGINKKLLEIYIESVIAHDEIGQKISIPKRLYTNVEKTRKDKSLTRQFVHYMDSNNHKLPVKGNATITYYAFKEYLAQNKLKAYIAIEVALREYLEKRIGDISNLLNEKHEERKTILDVIDTSKILDKYDNDDNAINKHILIEPEMFALAKTVIDNYNLSYESNSNMKLDFSSFISLCLAHFYKTRSDFMLKYGNRKAYDELLMLQKQKDKLKLDKNL